MPRELSLFMAARHAATMTPAGLDAVQSALVQASARFSAAGRPVCYLRSTYLPDQKCWTAMFSAVTRETGHDAVEMAQLPSVKVFDAVEPSAAV